MTPDPATAAAVASEVGTGVVTGGWGYVTAAYSLSWVCFIGYAASLWARWPTPSDRAPAQTVPGGSP